MLVIVILSFFWIKNNQTIEIKESPEDYVTYENLKGKYKMMIPKGWSVEEASDSGLFISRVIFRPTRDSIKIGNLAELSVTIVPGTSTGSAYSSQAEFDEWFAKPETAATMDGIFKTKNETLSNNPSVRISELATVEEKNTKFWSSTTWSRIDNNNYYINMMGNGPGDFAEESRFSWLISKFEAHPIN